MSALILPSSMTRESRGGVAMSAGTCEAIYCANCGKPGGDSIRAPGNFVFWICDLCNERLGPVVAGGVTPLAPQRQRLVDVQFEEYGRQLAPIEIHKQLSDVNSPLSILARDFPR